MNESTTAADRKLDELIEEQKAAVRFVKDIFKRDAETILSLLQTIKTDREALKYYAERVASMTMAQMAIDSSNKTIEAL